TARTWPRRALICESRQPAKRAGTLCSSPRIRSRATASALPLARATDRPTVTRIIAAAPRKKRVARPGPCPGSALAGPSVGGGPVGRGGVVPPGLVLGGGGAPGGGVEHDVEGGRARLHGDVLLAPPFAPHVHHLGSRGEAGQPERAGGVGDGESVLGIDHEDVGGHLRVDVAEDMDEAGAAERVGAGGAAAVEAEV